MKLTAFNLTKINVMGQIRLPVKYRDVIKNIKFIVTNFDTATVIGRNDAVYLHCVEFLCHNCDQCKNDDSMCVKSLSTPDTAKMTCIIVRSVKLTLARKPISQCTA